MRFRYERTVRSAIPSGAIPPRVCASNGGGRQFCERKLMDSYIRGIGGDKRTDGHRSYSVHKGDVRQHFQATPTPRLPRHRDQTPYSFRLKPSFSRMAVDAFCWGSVWAVTMMPDPANFACCAYFPALVVHLEACITGRAGPADWYEPQLRHFSVNRTFNFTAVRH